MKNVWSLYALQVGQYLIPLLTTPYLARVLGAEQFGILGVSAGVIAYFSTIIDWGFNYTAVQYAARASHDQSRLRELVTDVISARIIVALLCFAPLVLAICYAEDLGGNSKVLAAQSIGLLGSVFGLGWLLQGLERMATYAWITMVGRCLAVPLTFVFVRSPADSWVSAAIFSGTGLVSMVAGLAMVRHLTPIKLRSLRIKRGLRALADGWHVFLSTGAIGLYTSCNIVLLGALSGPLQAGYFNGAERIKRVVQSGVGPLSTAMYPRINNLLEHDHESAWRAMKALLFVQGGVTLFLSIAMFISAPWVTANFLGPSFIPSIPTVQWLAATPFLVGVSNVLGINIMLPMGMKSSFMWITLAGGALNLLLLVPLSRAFGSAGAAASVVLVEAMVTFVMAAVVYKAGIYRLRFASDNISSRP